MSQTSQRDREERIHPDGHPQSAPNWLVQPTRERSDFGDSSEPFFSFYSKIAEEEDNKMTDRWQKDANGILIFTGLFSAAVATLLVMSVQDIRPNLQDTSAFYLGNIYQILADPNATVPRPSFPSIVAVPPPFSPPRCAVWVNSLWFLSLVISLTCALLATSLHQSARRYIRFTQPARCSPEKRARMRAFFAGGMNKMHFPWAVEVLPALMHLSLFLFFAGLAIFLSCVNHSVFISVIWWMGLFLAVYLWITLMPILRQDSPYYSPLSSASWSLHASVLHAFHKVLAYVLLTCHAVPACVLFACPTVLWFTNSDIYFIFRAYERFDKLSRHYGHRMLGGVSKAAEETVLKHSSEIGLGILDWTIDALGEDDTTEKFLETIPGFFDSRMEEDSESLVLLSDALRRKFAYSLSGFLARTLLSTSISEEVKIRRLAIGVNATNATCDSFVIHMILDYLCRLPFDQVPQSIQTAEILARWCTSSNKHSSFAARLTTACILSHMRERDERWIALAMDKLGLPERIVRDNVSRGDNSVSLSIFIHMTRQVFPTNPAMEYSLLSLSKFDIHNAVPGLQNEFCALWNEMVLEERVNRYSRLFLLHKIRHLYLALHQGTDASFDLSDRWSFPLCNVAAHHPNPAVPSPTQLDPSPHTPPLEGHQIPGGRTSPQQPEEADIVPGLLSSKDSVPTAQQFPSASPNTDPVDIAPQDASLTGPSIHQPIDMVALDSNPLVSIKISHLSQPSLSYTTDELTPDMPINEVGENSNTPAAASHTYPRHDLVPATVSPSTLSRLPLVSVQQTDRDKQQHVLAPQVASDMVRISSTADQIPLSIPTIALQSNEERSVVPPPSIISASISSPITVPARHSSVISPELPSTVDAALIQPGYISHPPRSLSSPQATAYCDITTPVISTSDVHGTTSAGAFSAHDNTCDLAPPIAMDISHHENESVPSNPSIAQHPITPADHQDG